MRRQERQKKAAEIVLMDLLRIAAMYVDLADQLLQQCKRGSLPGISLNRDIAWNIGVKAVGETHFKKLIKDAACA